MSIEVMISTLRGEEIPDGWSHYSNGNVSAIAPDEFWNAASNHPEVIRHHKEQVDKDTMKRIKSLRIIGTPDAWGVS